VQACSSCIRKNSTGMWLADVMQFVILAFGPLGQRARSAARGEAASVSGQAVVRSWGSPRCVFPPVQLRLAISVPRAGRLCLHPVCRACSSRALPTRLCVC
jgi:hypothetical protein